MQARMLDFASLTGHHDRPDPSHGADANKTVTYWLRWASTRGETGPWSAAVSATVPG